MKLPEKLGRYRVLDELGQGAMGRVYLGHDPDIDRKVALKAVHLPEGLSPEARREGLARFQREVQAAGKLAHPNIVTIYDLGRDPVFGTFIAMEYVEGRSLQEHTTDRQLLAPRLVASIACQAADALAYAHRQGIVHRDIKPANLILVGERTVKIADFGLAKPVGASLTMDGTLVGTPYYMSPEQIQGQTVDGRSDLFSLAVVVYELLTGKRPFRGESISTVIYRILHEPPVEPDLGRLDTGLRVKDFLGRALAKNPEQRFQTGDEFARRLREAFTPQTEEGARVPAGAPATAPKGPQGAPGRPGDARRVSAAVKPAAPPPRARTRPGAAVRRRRPGSDRRRRRRRTLTPLLVVLAAAAVAAFVYRDTLFEFAEPYLPVAGGIGDRQPDQEPAPMAGGPPDEAATEPIVPPVRPGDEATDSAAAAPGPPAPAETPEEAVVPPSLPRLVQLASEPPGAAFEVEGRALPADRLPAPEPGETLTVRAVLGCQEAERSITAAEAGSRIVFSLQPAQIPVEVVSTPSAATIRVDGRRQGRTPAALTLDGCQEHEIVLSRDDYQDWSRTLPLESGRLQAPATLSADLKPVPKGFLVAPSPPYPVTMEIEGGGKLAPGQRLRLRAATYRLTLSSADLMYRRQLRVTVHADKTASLEVDFPPLAKLTIRAQPSNASIEIFADGLQRDLGPPPIFAESVVSGTYNVRCKFLHNEEVQERSVTLAAGENPPVVFVAER